MRPLTGTFTVHLSDGEYVYPFRSATVRVIPEGTGCAILWYVQAEKGTGKDADDADDTGDEDNEDDMDEAPPIAPNAELLVYVDRFDLHDAVGRRFYVPVAYDVEAEDHVATIYYYEHEDLNENLLEVVDRDGDALRVRWTGTAPSLEGYDPPAPVPPRVVIEGWFQLEGPGPGTAGGG